MRISNSQRKSISTELTQLFGSGAQIWLLGSRVDDNRRGGDVDLYVEVATTPDKPVAAKARAVMALEDIFDGARVDLLIRYPERTRNRYKLSHVKPGCYYELGI